MTKLESIEKIKLYKFYNALAFTRTANKRD